MKNFVLYARVLISLGIFSVLRYIWYKLFQKLKIYKRLHIPIQFKKKDFFVENIKAKSDLVNNKQWLNTHIYFGWYLINSQEFPNWFKNPFNGKVFKGSSKHWSEITDFDNSLGDIKTIWDVSRFSWVVSFAQSASIGNQKDLTKLNNWIHDWIDKNPPYFGPNWKCGQEASIRLIHLAAGALILKQTLHSSPSLLSLVQIHLERIYPTIMYAIAQDNNHGVSEAAALYIGGSWLKLQGNKEGDKFYKTGRKWLENRAKVLIQSDGSFSQHSINYHRLMLDTFSIVEVWRRKMDLKVFSPSLYIKLSSASNWLFQFTNFKTGKVPNLGANDGTRIIPFTDSDQCDYRPTVQLSKNLFCNERAFKENGIYDLSIDWLDLEHSKTITKPRKSEHFCKGGYFLLRNKKSFCLLNYPKFKFRPSQSDALHVDFWIGENNIFRDAGTFSYNLNDDEMLGYVGPKGHNTIQFDNFDQMPKLSRFLYGSWLKPKNVLFDFSPELSFAEASYKDWRNVNFFRRVELSERLLKVSDIFDGVKKIAVLRWRLIPCNWKLTNNILSSRYCEISIISSVKINRIELINDFESRFYLQKSPIQILEVEIIGDGKITTEVRY